MGQLLGEAGDDSPNVLLSAGCCNGASPHPSRQARRLRPTATAPCFPLTFEEFEAIADEARRLGLRTTCHTYGHEEAAYSCVRAGFDVPMHMMDLDDTLLQEIVENGTSVQISFNDAYAGGFPDGRGPRWVKTEELFVRLLAAGIPIPFGSGSQGSPFSDTRPRRIGKQANIFSVFVRLGMTPAQALNSALMVAANDLTYRTFRASTNSVSRVR